MVMTDGRRCVMAKQCKVCKMVGKIVKKEGKDAFDAAFGVDMFSGPECCEDTMTFNDNPTRWRKQPWQR
jgi:hypothetical protein